MPNTDWKSAESEDRLREAVKSSSSIAGVLRKLRLQAVGGNYRTIKHHITRLSLDTSHHTGQAWNRDNYTLPNQESKKTTWKRFLVRRDGHRCGICGLTEWLGHPIPLEIDHINGDHSDNTEANVRILCCNCHAQTDTWRRKKFVKAA